MMIVVVAKDRAGNETKTELTVNVVEAKTPTTGLAFAISLDRALVKPGETVVAEIHAVQDGVLRADLPITVHVGIQTLGTFRTDANGFARVVFAAPRQEIESVAVVVLGGGATGRATFTVAKPATPAPTTRP
jgi:hypothetical protein